MPRDRNPPPTPQAAAMRAAADIIGSEKLAAQLDIAPRTMYALMNGTRRVQPGIIADTRLLLIRHRQKCGQVIAAIRAVEAGELDDLIHRHELEDLQEADDEDQG